MPEDSVAQSEIAALTRRFEEVSERTDREFGIVKSDLTAVRLRVGNLDQKVGNLDEKVGELVGAVDGLSEKIDRNQAQISSCSPTGGPAPRRQLIPAHTRPQPEPLNLWSGPPCVRCQFSPSRCSCRAWTRPRHAERTLSSLVVQGGRRLRQGQGGYEVGDVNEVGEEVVGGGQRAQPADDSGQLLVLAADCVVEGEGELHEPVQEGESGSLDVGLQALGAVGDAAGSGVLDQGHDLGKEGVGALVEVVEELVCERELVVGPVAVGEGDGQGEADLHHGALADGTVLLGLSAAGFEGGDGGSGVGVGPADVTEDPVVAALPAQGGDGGQGGGEVTG